MNNSTNNAFFLLCFLYFSGLTNSKAIAVLQKDSLPALLQQESLSIEFVGDANLQSVVSNNMSGTATGGLGIIVNKSLLVNSESKWKIFKEFSIDASINVATTSDTLVLYIENSQSVPLISNLSDVGTFILLPSVTKQYATGTFVGYFNDLQKKKMLYRIISGLRFRVGGANANFTFNNSSNQPTNGIAENIGLTVFYITVGLFYDIIPHERRKNNNYSFKIGVDFSERLLFGDIGQSSFEMQRLNLFGTDQRGFFGYEPFVSIKLKNLVIEASLPSLFPQKDDAGLKEDFPGLTNSRLVTTIRFVGGFSLKID